MTPDTDQILLGSNHTAASRYTHRTGYTADIARVGPLVDGNWSLSCNWARITPGTLALFARTGDGGTPPLAGWMVATAPAAHDATEDSWYLPGRIEGWTPRRWINGDDIGLAGWPATRSPWGINAVRQCRNGERITRGQLAIILPLIPATTRRRIAATIKEVTGVPPWWATGHS